MAIVSKFQVEETIIENRIFRMYVAVNIPRSDTENITRCQQSCFVIEKMSGKAPVNIDKLIERMRMVDVTAAFIMLGYHYVNGDAPFIEKLIPIQYLYLRHSMPLHIACPAMLVWGN
jgi:hypothetical protein